MKCPAQCGEPLDALEKLGHRFDHHRIGRRRIECGAQACLFVAGGENAEMGDALEAAWQLAYGAITIGHCAIRPHAVALLHHRPNGIELNTPGNHVATNGTSEITTAPRNIAPTAGSTELPT